MSFTRCLFSDNTMSSFLSITVSDTLGTIVNILFDGITFLRNQQSILDVSRPSVAVATQGKQTSWTFQNCVFRNNSGSITYMNGGKISVTNCTITSHVSNSLSTSTMSGNVVCRYAINLLAFELLNLHSMNLTNTQISNNTNKVLYLEAATTLPLIEVSNLRYFLNSAPITSTYTYLRFQYILDYTNLAVSKILPFILIVNPLSLG